MKTEIPFTLDGIAGELKIEYGVLNFKVFQDGIEVKKQGKKAKPKFTVKNQNGGDDTIQLTNSPIKGFIVEHNGSKIKLEKNLSTVEILMGFIPVVIFVVGMILFGGILGVIGGALLGAIIALSVMINYRFIRNNQDIGVQLGVSVAIGICAYLVYFIVGMILHSMLSHLIWG